MSTSTNVRIAVKLDGFGFNDQVVHTFRYSNNGFVATIGNDSGQFYYEPFVHSGILFETKIGDTDDGIAIDLANDGSLSELIDYSFVGRNVSVYINRTGSPSPDNFYTMFIGTVKSILVQKNIVKIRAASHFEIFDTPMNPAKFTGVVADFEGNSDFEGKVKPRLLGKVFNIRPELIWPSHLVYGVNWDYDGNRSPILAFSNPRDGGLDLILDIDAPGSTNGDYTTTTLMDANITTPDGEYITCLDEGTFKLGSSPNFSVTIDVEQETTTYADWVQLIVLELGLDGYIINSSPDYDLGVYATSEVDYVSINNELSRNLDIYLWFGYNNNLNVVEMIDVTLTTPEVNFIEDGLNLTDNVDIVAFSINRIDSVLPPKEVQLNYRKNYSVQSDADLAGLAETDDEKVKYKEDYAYSIANLSCVIDPYLLNKTEDFETAIRFSVDASTHIVKWLGMRDQVLDYFEISCPILAANDGIVLGVIQNEDLDYINISSTTTLISDGTVLISHTNAQYSEQRMLQIGDCVTIKTKDYDYSSHKFSVYSISVNTRTMQVVYKIYGKRTISDCSV